MARMGGRQEGGQTPAEDPSAGPPGRCRRRGNAQVSNAAGGRVKGFLSRAACDSGA